jgi:membrane-associated phospholipid phosphatase
VIAHARVRSWAQAEHRQHPPGAGLHDLGHCCLARCGRYVWVVRAWIVLFSRQLALVVGAALAYFGVRGVTEGEVEQARRHAADLLALERSIGIDVETALQRAVLDHEWLLTTANWVYIWFHWPLLTITLVWLLVAHRDRYVELRNAIFASGAIGLLIYVSLPMAPPRLFSAEFVDTVTQHSHSYRVLQPPGLVNKYAAMPSLHVGWNLLAGIAWWHAGRVGGKRRSWSIAAVAMPIAMAWATVATGNHWVLDAIVGSLVALAGLAVARRLGRRPLEQVGHLAVAHRAEVAVVLADSTEVARRLDGDVPVRGVTEVGDPAARCHRNGEHDPPRPACSRDLARRSRRRTGRETVVDDDHHPTIERA